MIKSMTGFGKAEYANDKRKITVEIKTLNSKQADITVKTPNVYKEKEVELRNELTASLLRGKIEVYVAIDETSGDEDTRVNEAMIRAYYSQLLEIAQNMGIKLPDDILNTIIRMPDVIKPDRPEPDEAEWAMMFNGLRDALKQVNDFRIQEGAALASDLITRVNLIYTSVADVEMYEDQRMDIIKNRLKQNLLEYVGEAAIDQNRFEQELIYYLEKIDINEEKVRLRNHCSYFLETMNEEGSVGKKLGFIAQEIGREINTIGSKANHADMQQIVIRMKDELEKVKEQVLNIL